MNTKDLPAMVEETVVKIEQYLADNLPHKWLDIHDYIVWLNLYLMEPESQTENQVTEVIEMLAKCRKILEFGDRISALKPKYNGDIFGMN